MLHLGAVADIDAARAPPLGRVPQRRRIDHVLLERVEVGHPHCGKLAEDPTLAGVGIRLAFERPAVAHA